ncbi:delta 8-sphingoloid desaturase protein [Sistotremastrum niveocremeum HHB9708]|uniref:Delta 8-(E)-sphingolipid desaturase n=2 Tax=Sistotremastraceae TaxID=3402574 RepID=A0A164VDY9_9AGAM|nr:delta 8-sphingoloid desaturase protein [Sistotremastrum niveocremeum HHB9708]KZT32977.1 delta 8-sphingoloid desaturase protein [Sistotremastrum suecicum HHB10207 ss-3]
MNSERIWTRREVADGILQGDTLVILGDSLLRIPDSWLVKHPGGALAILHFVGRDAQNEIAAYHPEEALKRIRSFIVGKVESTELGWEPFIPPVQSGWIRKNGEWYQEARPLRLDGTIEPTPQSQILLVDKDIVGDASSVTPTMESLISSPPSLSRSEQWKQTREYDELHRRIKEQGLYATPFFTGYGPEVLRYTLLGLLAALTYYQRWYICSAIFLGGFWHQLTFTAHDLGHNGVTHSWVIDRLLGVFIADFLGGLSIGWWVDNHNIHHLVTNHPSHDPDIQHIPFFAISPHFLTSLWSSYYKRVMAFDAFSTYLIGAQHMLFYVVMSLARFNLYANSYSFLFKHARDRKDARGGKFVWWLEIACIALFWCWFGLLLKGIPTWRMRALYLLVSHVVPSPLHVQIVLSHFSRSTEDLGPFESFPHRQLRTTTDVKCDPSVEFLHGGLHLQVTHHLFPRLPRHNLKRASVLVKEFAAEHGLEYAEFGFVEGNAEVRGVLRSVAEQVGILMKVAKSEALESVAGNNM